MEFLDGMKKRDEWYGKSCPGHEVEEEDIEGDPTGAMICKICGEQFYDVMVFGGERYRRDRRN